MKVICLWLMVSGGKRGSWDGWQGKLYCGKTALCLGVQVNLGKVTAPGKLCRVAVILL